MKKGLWTKNFTLVTVASALGAVGGIAGNFALSFLVFDETGSTLASALILAMELVPCFVIPLFAAPWMDRLPRKPFLVGGDLVNGVMYLAAGIYLLLADFSYIGYLCFSVLISSLSAFDELAYNSIYPKLIPDGQEEKGYTVSSMLYPVMKVIMTPLAAVLMECLGVGKILLLQGGLSMAAAAIESRIQVEESCRSTQGRFSVRVWWQDIKEAAAYLKRERGLRGVYTYTAVTNGMATGYSPLLVAFFRTMPGFTAAMYSLFSVAEFLGRSLGGLVQYHVKIPKKRRFPAVFLVYQIYETMDMCLLWLPYPLMLANRGICGFLGVNSAVMRQAAVQRYLPETLRARINAFESMLTMAAGCLLSLAVGALAEVVDYRLCMSICGGVTLLVCWLSVGRRRKEINRIYMGTEDDAQQSGLAQA